MIKLEIENLEYFLNLIGWNVLEMGEIKKGHFVYATKEKYADNKKPANTKVLMIELI
jgi:hypothetical protein